MPTGWRFIQQGVECSVDNGSDSDAFGDWAGGGDSLPMGPVPLLEFVESGHTVDFAPGMGEGFAHELVEAAARGDVVLVKRILASKLAKGGADAVSAGRSALYVAIELDQMVAAEALVAAGATVQSSAICCALSIGVEQCRRLLAAVESCEKIAPLDEMVQVVAPGEGSARQYSPLGLACASGNEPATALLLHAAADPNMLADGVRCRTALHIAAGVGSIGCVKALLEAGARTDLAAGTGHGLEPVQAPAEPCLRLPNAPPVQLDRAAALRLLGDELSSCECALGPSEETEVELDPQPQPELQPALDCEGHGSCFPCVGQTTLDIEMDAETKTSQARAAADTAAAALLEEVAAEERRKQQRRDKKRNKKKRAKLRRQINPYAGDTESSSSCAGSQADGDIVTELVVEATNAPAISVDGAQLAMLRDHEKVPSHESEAEQGTDLQVEGDVSSDDLNSLRARLAAAQALASAHEKECLQLRQQLEQIQKTTGGSDKNEPDVAARAQAVGECGIEMPGTPPRRPGSCPSTGDSSSAASISNPTDGPMGKQLQTQYCSAGLSDVASTSATASPDPESHQSGEELEIAKAIIRSQYQTMQEAGLRYHIASFGSIAPGGSDRLGINFGKDGATWPVVAEVTAGSLADNIRPPLVGSRLHSIAGKDGRSVHVAGLGLEDGLALVRAIGRPLLLTFERATQTSVVDQCLAPTSVKVCDGERCPSPELLQFEGAVEAGSRYQQAFENSDASTFVKDEGSDLEDETEEEDYQDAEEHPVLYSAARSDDVDDGASITTGEADEHDDTVLGEAVRELRVLLNAWLQHVHDMEERRSNSKNVNAGGAKPIVHIYVYGSCLLFGDVVEDDSDIDILVVAPSIVDRHFHFFGPQPERADTLAQNDSDRANALGNASMGQDASERSSDKSILAQLVAADPRVCELVQVREAYVPCLRFKFNGRAIDLTLATPGLESPLPGEAAQSRGCGWHSDLPAGLMNEAVLQSLRSVLNCTHHAHALVAFANGCTC